MVPAVGADMPVKARPQPAAAAYVTSFYVGVAGGWGWGRSKQTDDTPFSSGSMSDSVNGGLIGGTWGSNWQFGRVVLGLESDMSYARIKGSTVGTDVPSGPCIPPHCEADLRWLGTTRGRVGYAYDRVLPYVTAGLADGNVRASEGTGAFPTGGSGSKTVWGWAAGAGVEAVVAPRWTVKLEYLYADLGRHGIFTETFGGIPFTQSVDMRVHTVRIGLNYKLGTSLLAVLRGQ